QAGCLGAPPFDAIITIRSPSLVYTSGVVKGRPLFAPVVVSRSRGAFTNGPLRTLPPLARNSSISFWLNSRIAFSLNSAMGCLLSFAVELMLDCDEVRVKFPFWRAKYFEKFSRARSGLRNAGQICPRADQEMRVPARPSWPCRHSADNSTRFRPSRRDFTLPARRS